MRSGYTILEHPADVGIEAHGRTLGEALALAAEGLMSIILDPASVHCAETRTIRITASDREQLVVKWLSEILFLFDGEEFVSRRFAVDELTATSLCATLEGEHFDRQRHTTRIDVKAITYHQLTIADHRDEWTLRVFLDI